MTASRIRLLLPSLLLAAGIAVGGHFIGQGIADRNDVGRTISVKGLSEREVAASIAIWNVGFQATGNELSELNQKLGDSTQAVVNFLKQAGFDEQELAVQPPGVRDTRTDFRGKDTPPPPERYSAHQSVLLRTSKVGLVKPALASVSSLMMSGVLTSGSSEPNYVFNQRKSSFVMPRRVNRFRQGRSRHGTSPQGQFDPTLFYLPGTLGWSHQDLFYYFYRPLQPWLLPYPVILTTPPRFGVQSDEFGFVISWTTNAQVVVDATSDPRDFNWTPVATNGLTDGWTYFSDPDWSKHPFRLYRLR